MNKTFAFAMLFAIAITPALATDVPLCSNPAQSAPLPVSGVFYSVSTVPESNLGVHRLVLCIDSVEVKAWDFYANYEFVRKDQAIYLHDSLGTIYYSRSNPAFLWWQHRDQRGAARMLHH